MERIEGGLAIVGCGLIGSSIAAAIRQKTPNQVIVGLDLPDKLDRIRHAGLFDEVIDVETRAQDGLIQSRLVILATPVQMILGLLRRLAPHFQAGTIVTDVGSTKTQIVELAKTVLPQGIHFVGGHPIAGSQHAGVEAADPLLFKDRIYVLCPQPNTPPEVLLTLMNLIDDLLAFPMTMEAHEHDQILATVSHVPHLIAVAMMVSALQADASHRLLDVMAGPGFLDLTRIAASDYSMWESVFDTNHQSVSRALGRMEDSLKEIRQAFDSRSGELAVLWERASKKRRSMSADTERRLRKVDLRALIDHHDERILKALHDRLKTVQRIGRQKKDQNAPVNDPDRERRLLQQRKRWGQALGLQAEFIEELFRVIIGHSKKMQSEME